MCEHGQVTTAILGYLPSESFFFKKNKRTHYVFTTLQYDTVYNCAKRNNLETQETEKESELYICHDEISRPDTWNVLHKGYQS